jgi:hypothetical protein
MCTSHLLFLNAKRDPLPPPANQILVFWTPAQKIEHWVKTDTCILNECPTVASININK